MAEPDPGRVLRKGADVVAAVDLRDVPAGTKGRVALVNGLTWIRYWVRFANGVTIGSVNRSALATPKEWERRLASGGDDGDAAVVGDTDDEADAAVDDGGGATVNGVLVPARLLERTKAARARLGA